MKSVRGERISQHGSNSRSELRVLLYASQQRVFYSWDSSLEDLIRESLGLKDKSKKKETVTRCEELRERVEETRVLLGHITEAKSESSRRTYVSLNKELLLLWQEFFKECPKNAKKHLREDTELGMRTQVMEHKKNIGARFCWNCCFLNEKDAIYCKKCGEVVT